MPYTAVHPSAKCTATPRAPPPAAPTAHVRASPPLLTHRLGHLGPALLAASRRAVGGRQAVSHVHRTAQRRLQVRRRDRGRRGLCARAQGVNTCRTVYAKRCHAQRVLFCRLVMMPCPRSCCPLCPPPVPPLRPAPSFPPSFPPYTCTVPLGQLPFPSSLSIPSFPPSLPCPPPPHTCTVPLGQLPQA